MKKKTFVQIFSCLNEEVFSKVKIDCLPHLFELLRAYPIDDFPSKSNNKPSIKNEVAHEMQKFLPYFDFKSK